MSDFSWLNLTPHVYASQPLSPVATQHSLPSGRLTGLAALPHPALGQDFTPSPTARCAQASLLGPDFHRLDRTSFAWRTHSITSSARARSVIGTSMPSALAVLVLITSSNLVG